MINDSPEWAALILERRKIMARFFADGDELLYRKDLMKLFDLSKNNVLNPDNLANKNFDLNSKWYGMKVAQEDVPINGKENWSLYFDFEVDGYNRIQLNISVNSNIYIRSFSGQQIWSDWKQIGGVLSSALSHLYQYFSYLLVNRKVAM